MSDYSPIDRIRRDTPVHELFWPWGKFSILGFVVGVLSMISIWFFAVDASPGTILSGILNSYNEILNRILGWITPLAEYALSIVELHIHFDPQWKHAFVLLSLYFSAGAWAELKARHTLLALVRGCAGVFLALLTGLFVGSLELTKAWLPSFLFAALPAVATALNDLLLVTYRRLFQQKKSGSSTKWIMLRTIVCLGVAAVVPILPGLSHPGLTGLALVMAIHAANQIRLAAHEVRIWQSGPNSSEPAYSLFLQSKAGLMALRMVSLVFWALALLVLDFGWEHTPWA